MKISSPTKHAIIFFLFAIPLSTHFYGCKQSDSKEQLETSDDIELYSDTIPLFLDNGAMQTCIYINPIKMQ